jgi:kinesin family protein 2/24
MPQSRAPQPHGWDQPYNEGGRKSGTAQPQNVPYHQQPTNSSSGTSTPPPLTPSDRDEAHQQLIDRILESEEDLLANHRRHIDDMMELLKAEMRELNEVDRPETQIEDYCHNLSVIIDKKLDRIHSFKRRLDAFRDLLRQEEAMSRPNLASAAVPNPRR